MPWLRFTAPFDWHPQVNVIFAYRPGEVKLVTRRCAAEALAAGKAEKTVNPDLPATPTPALPHKGGGGNKEPSNG